MNLQNFKRLVKTIIKEEMEKSEEYEDPTSVAKNRAKSEHDWAKDALAHGISEKKLKTMSEKEIEELKDYIDSCNKTT
jgi:hypothetical protein